ncbi:MAG: TonB-dependent receptor [Pyrinomonadaceae bacterium]
MKFFIRSFFTFLFLSILAFPVFPQINQGNLSGKITDSSGAALAGVRINARSKATGEEFTVQTDSAGNFHLENLPEGEYRLTAEAAGFSSSSREISLPANKNIEISLAVGNISETVTVTATRTELTTTETAVPVSILGREELERGTFNTIGDVFRNLPATSTVNEGAFQVRPRIRGLDSNRVLILVDGERLNNARTSTGQSGVEIGLVEVEQIQTLEVARGAGSVLYGTDALAGTINIITKDTPARRANGFRFGGTFNGFYSSNENGRRASLAINGSNNFFAFRVSQSLERFDNYFTGNNKGALFDGVTAGGEVLNSQSHGGNTQATVRFFLNENSNLKFNYERRRAANIGSPTLVGVFNAFFPFSNRDKFSTRYEGTNFNKYLARVSASFYYQRQNRNFTNILNVPAAPPFFPGQYQSSETVTDTKTAGFDVQSNWLLSTKNLLTAGFSFFRDTNNDERFIRRRTPNFAVFPPALVSSEDRTKSVPDANFGSFAVFAQDQFDLTSRLKLTGGVRVDYFRSNAKPTTGFALPASFTASQIEDLGLNGLTSGLNVSQTAITGDFGVVYKLTENVSLTGRVGRSFRVPNLFERFFTDAGSVGGFVVGNPNLKPESGINFDAGAKFRTSKFAGSLTYFNNTYRDFLSNQLAFDRNGQPIRIILPGQTPIDVYQTINIGKARIQGVEVEGEYPIKLGSGFLTPGGNFSYLRGDDLTADQPLNFITPLKTVLNLRWQDLQSRYFAEWTTRVAGKQSRLSPAFFQLNGGAESGFAVSEIRGGYNFRREHYRLSINAGLNNLFNRYYFEQFVFAPARGRSFVVGTTWEIF